MTRASPIEPLARLFLNPSFSELKGIYRSLHRIWFHLKPDNFICASTDEHFDECEKTTGGGVDTAFTNTESGIGVGATVLCPVFWSEKFPCRAMTLIHESAHAVGIGNGATHPPNREDAAYPFTGPTPAGQTTAMRVDNPDAYANFAAHVGRESEFDCTKVASELPLSPRGVIQIEDTAPKK